MILPNQKPDAVSRRRLGVDIVGCGNIGSHFAPEVARNTGIASATLIDPAVFDDPRNVLTQNITRAELGHAKAKTLARRMRDINPELAVVAIVARLADVPLARLTADLLVAGLDSLGSRLEANEVARRLGMIYIDLGISAQRQLVRVSVFDASRDSACYECRVTAEEYQEVEAVDPCGGRRDEPPPTNAPTYLGALAAALAAAELQKRTQGNDADALVSQQIIYDVSRHKQYVARLVRNPDCRFEHAPAWEITRLDSGPHDLTLGQALALGEPGRGPARLSIEPHRFAHSAMCLQCRTTRRRLMLHRTAPQQANCPKCRKRTPVVPVELAYSLSETTLCSQDLNWPLARLGLMPEDVFSVERGGAVRHFALAADESLHAGSDPTRRREAAGATP